MPWPFVGRCDQAEHVRCALRGDGTGAILVTAESGMGRTTFIHHVLRDADPEQDRLIHLAPAGHSPLAAVRPHLPAGLRVSRSIDIRDVATAVADGADGRRIVAVVDDAHLTDQASLLALRQLCRSGRALLLLSRPNQIGPCYLPDPTECLRYEQCLTTLRLPPLSADEVGMVLAGMLDGPVSRATSAALHAATGGNPRLLRQLVVGGRITEHMTDGAGARRLAATRGRSRAKCPPEVAEPLVRQTWQAWRDFALDRADELCRLALRYRMDERVACVWSTILLLRGQAQRGLRFLDALPGADPGHPAELALSRAMLLAVGLGRADEAAESLAAAAAAGDRDHRDRCQAYRAWILAVSGGRDAASAALTGIGSDTGEHARAFVDATYGVLAFAAGRHAEAVSRFRRALAVSTVVHDDLPWLLPYLVACLIDALLLVGRMTEATALAAGFHGARHSSGWDVAAALAALIQHAPATRGDRRRPRSVPPAPRRPVRDNRPGTPGRQLVDTIDHSR